MLVLDTARFALATRTITLSLEQGVAGVYAISIHTRYDTEFVDAPDQTRKTSYNNLSDARANYKQILHILARTNH
jgi:hypothetical protein